MRSLLLIACFSCFTLLGSGCQYLADRGNDALDVVGLELSAGPQFGASVRANKLLQAGFRYQSGEVFSINGRRIAGYQENRVEAGLPLFYYNFPERKVYWSNDNYDKYAEYAADEAGEWYDLDREFDRPFWSVGGNVSVGFIGLGLHLDFMQLSDFFLGLFTIDFCYDDARNEERDPRTGPMPHFHKIEHEEE